jgi:hypothetical protein
VRRAVAVAAALVLLFPAASLADPPKSPRLVTVGRICDLIETHATRHGLPSDFLARLIWKESRFDPSAVSPAGAEGIAQFMPGTAAMRGLSDPYDIDQAIPASARYLAELSAGFGNLGLAAAAYNAGENRVARWVSKGGFLPLETENYVLDIMGAPADSFVGMHEATVPPLDGKASFGDSCRKLPASAAMTVAMATVHSKPWGVQVAGNFRRDAAVRQWQGLKARHPALPGREDAVVSRIRTPIGRRGIYAVRIGADDRKSGDAICAALRASGGACIVMRNR